MFPNIIQKYTNEIIFGSILIIGAVLRFYNYADLSLSHDELSGLRRLHFDNFADLINQAVKPDGHPAGIQVFLYFWTWLFGNSAAAVRLPFVIAGILSVWIAFLITSKWINKYAGLFVAASVAFLEFPLMFSQIARMYSPGLLFSLLTVWFWTNLLFSDKKKLPTTAGYIISSACSMYIHYFSFLFITIVGITGLFFLNRKNIRYYILAAVLIMILFIPHINITICHLNKGGLGDFLPEPGDLWFAEHIYHCFNNSLIVTFCFLLILLVTLSLTWKKIIITKFQVFALIWFVLPILTGYFYSIYVNPLLQNSILLFSFPFLPVFIFSFVNKNYRVLNYILLGVFCTTLLFSTLVEKKFYSTEHFTPYKKMMQYVLEWEKKYGEDNITKTTNINPYIINYYQKYFNSGSGFDVCGYEGNTDNSRIIQLIKNRNTPYFLHCRVNLYSADEILDLIRSGYPAIIKKQAFFNGEMILYGKDPLSDSYPEIKPAARFTQGFEQEDIPGGSRSYLDTMAKNGNFAYRIEDNIEYSPHIKKDIVTISKEKYNKIKISLWCKPLTDIDNVILVLSIDANEENIYWRGMDLKNFITDTCWNQVFLNYVIPEDYIPQPGHQVSVYVWNRSKRSFLIDDMDIRFIFDDSVPAII